ncbi:hypothetical protein BFL35_11840 [Clavibacter michiganensis]|nr:hypothetical protein BFL35_11840 [Clavibacter michiganensis]
MDGKSCGTCGMVCAAGMEFWRDGAVGSDSFAICFASARVQWAVKSSSGAYASWVWTVGRGGVEPAAWAEPPASSADATTRVAAADADSPRRILLVTCSDSRSRIDETDRVARCTLSRSAPPPVCPRTPYARSSTT